MEYIRIPPEKERIQRNVYRLSSFYTRCFAGVNIGQKHARTKSGMPRRHTALKGTCFSYPRGSAVQLGGGFLQEADDGQMLGTYALALAAGDAVRRAPVALAQPPCGREAAVSFHYS